MAYLKPQSPLQHKSGDYFYPLTTADQVVMDDGSRLNTLNYISIDNEDIIEGEANPVNADTLGGYSAEYFLNNAGNSIPDYTEEDEGKILRIVNGVPTWVAIPNVREGTF